VLVKTTGLIVFLGMLALADTLTLRDGTSVEGSYVGGDSRHVRMLVGSDVQTYELSRVRSLQFGDSKASAASVPAANESPAAVANEDGAPPRMKRQHVDETTSDVAATAATAAPEQNSPGAGFVPATGAAQGPVTQAAAPAQTGDGSAQQASLIPAGTELAVRLDDAVDSQKDKVGQTYRATLTQDVTVNGQTLIPSGANVTAKLLDDQQSGKITGQTVLTLALTQIQVNGKTYTIDTTAVNQSSKGRGKQSAERIGGLSALGAIIGAIAGGGAGAAIGAGAGAAAGTGVQVLTKGQRVKVPAETKLVFSLQEPLQL
jgi:hypothetical protein